MKKNEKLYTYEQIAEELCISVKSVYNKVYTLCLKCVKYKNGRSLYNQSQFNIIKNSVKKNEIHKYYPIKTHEIWHIYQSKINL